MYTLALEELRGDRWEPFTPVDVQFEAVMLDPYIRKTMSVEGDLLVAKFKLPDHYGVYTFKVDYKRHGLTTVSNSETIQVRPYRHDQYPRFLVVARPYYANLFSLMAAFFAFTVVFLFHKSSVKKVKTE